MGSFRAYVGSRIKELRQKAGLTQDQLGRRAGMEAKVVGEYERGARNGTLDTIERLLKALGVTKYDLMEISPRVTSPADRDETTILHAVRGMKRGHRALVARMVKTLSTWSRGRGR